MKRQFESYTDRKESPIRVNPRIKIIFLLYASVLSVILDSVWALGTMAISCVLSAFFAGLSLKQLAFTFLAVVLVTWGTMFSQAVFYFGEPRTVLFNLVRADNPILGWITGEMNVYLEGFQYGAVQSLRFSAMLVLGFSLCWSTDARGLMQGLLGIRIPYILAFMTVTALRFLPGILKEADIIRQAWYVRGMHLFSWNPFQMAANWTRFLRPVLVNGYRKSLILSMSLQSRAFSPQQSGTHKSLVPLSPGAHIAGWLGFIVVTGILVGKVLYWFYLWGFFYHSSLRNLYFICRHYL